MDNVVTRTRGFARTIMDARETLGRCDPHNPPPAPASARSPQTAPCARSRTLGRTAARRPSRSASSGSDTDESPGATRVRCAATEGGEEAAQGAAIAAEEIDKTCKQLNDVAAHASDNSGMQEVKKRLPLSSSNQNAIEASIADDFDKSSSGSDNSLDDLGASQMKKQEDASLDLGDLKISGDVAGSPQAAQEQRKDEPAGAAQADEFDKSDNGSDDLLDDLGASPMKKQENVSLDLGDSLDLTLSGDAAGSPIAAQEQKKDKPASEVKGVAGARPCYDKFWCYSLAVPLDHWDARRTEKLSVTFIVHPAADPAQRRGSLLYAVGGPGMVAHKFAPQVLTWTPKHVLDSFDMVFFDQRGIGLSCGLWCPNTTAYSGERAMMWNTQQQRDAILRDARFFAEQCKRESANNLAGQCIVGSKLPKLAQINTVLPFLSTKQAIEDVFSFTSLIDGPFYFYGHSYGTQFGNAYALAHAQQLRGLILDCAVDLTVNDAVFWMDMQSGMINSTAILEAACSRDADCRRDLCWGSDCTHAFRNVFDGLRYTPVSVGFPLPTGEVVSRKLFLNKVESYAMSAMSDPKKRAGLLRAVAAGVRGNWLPMLRSIYWSSWTDVTTLAPSVGSADGDDSTASYWAILGSDYSYDFTPKGTTDPWAKGQSYFAATSATSGLPYASIGLYDLVIAFLQSKTVPRTLPPPLKAPGLPVLVIASDMDNAVPFSHSVNIWSRLDRGYLVVRPGGMHTLWGRGFDCVDSAVDKLLFDRMTPSDRRVTCKVNPEDIVAKFKPLVDPNVWTYKNPTDALKAVDSEILSTPEIAGWDMTYSADVGCSFGGYASMTPELVTLVDCQMLEHGMSVSGTISWPDNDSCNITGTAHGRWNGQFSYLRTGADVDLQWTNL
eukprot:m51a1_g3054 hypothetical protein (892) ;mRNA; f:957525-967602